MQIYDGADVVWINFEPIAHAHGVSQRSVVDDRMLVINAIYPHIRTLYAPEPGRGGKPSVRLCCVSPLAPTSVMMRSAVGLLMTVVRMLAAFIE